MTPPLDPFYHKRIGIEEAKRILKDDEHAVILLVGPTEFIQNLGKEVSKVIAWNGLSGESLLRQITKGTAVKAIFCFMPFQGEVSAVLLGLTLGADRYPFLSIRPLEDSRGTRPLIEAMVGLRGNSLPNGAASRFQGVSLHQAAGVRSPVAVGTVPATSPPDPISQPKPPAEIKPMNGNGNGISLPPQKVGARMTGRTRRADGSLTTSDFIRQEGKFGPDVNQAEEVARLCQLAEAGGYKFLPHSVTSTYSAFKHHPERLHRKPSSNGNGAGSSLAFLDEKFGSDESGSDSDIADQAGGKSVFGTKVDDESAAPEDNLTAREFVVKNGKFGQDVEVKDEIERLVELSVSEKRNLPRNSIKSAYNAEQKDRDPSLALKHQSRSRGGLPAAQTKRTRKSPQRKPADPPKPTPAAKPTTVAKPSGTSLPKVELDDGGLVDRLAELFGEDSPPVRQLKVMYLELARLRRLYDAYTLFVAVADEALE